MTPRLSPEAAGRALVSEGEAGHVITIRLLAGWVRLEIITPPDISGGSWLPLLAATASRFGHYGTNDGPQVLWAEFTIEPHGQ